MDKELVKRLIICIFIITAIAIAIAVNPFYKKNKDYSAPQIREQFANKLESLIRTDGSFLYEYNIEFKNEIDDYNILRHELSSYALLDYYEDKGCLDYKRDLVNVMLEYIKEQIVEDDTGNMFVVDSIEDEVKLGACALGLVNFCEYERLYQNDRYHEYIVKLANGILTMQRLDGRFNHVFNTKNFKLKEKDRIIYYEGEACVALCKAYSITKDEKYIEAVKKALDYYSKNNYYQKNDHWQERAVYEYMKIVQDEKYFDYGINNVLSGLILFSNKDRFANTDFELFKIALNLIEDFSSDESKVSFNRISDEYMKRETELIIEFNEASKVENKNMDDVEKYLQKIGKNHIRIDDLAHFILALK